MTQKYLRDGKIRKCATLPQGFYVFDKERWLPELVDPAYEGFRISFGPPERPKSGIQIITDTAEIRSVADGKTYTSKKKYYDSLKAQGSHVIEPGEHGHKRQLKGDYNVKRELHQAIQQHLGR